MSREVVLISISSLLILLALTFYIKDILKSKTKPRVVSWFSWGLLTFIAATASVSDHQYAAAVMSFSFSLLCFSIALLGWRRGEKHLTKLDVVCQFGVIVSLVLWWIFNSPSIAIIAVIVIDLIALIPTLEHSWQRPDEETWQQFILSGTAALLTIFAAESIRITSLANPIYIFLADYTTAAVIISRRRLLTK